MESKKKRPKKYCAVFNCLKTDCDSNLSFFWLPKDTEKRRTWLSAIGREDLLKKKNLKHSSYHICSSHFEKSDIKIVRKLTENAIPTILLANQSNEETSQTQVDKPTDDFEKSSPKVKIVSNKVNKKAKTNSVATQTESVKLSQEETQIWTLLSAKPPRKRKLQEELKNTKAKCRRLDLEIKKKIKKS